MAGSARVDMMTGRMLIKKGRSLSAAESCTGGLLSHRLTEVPGCSRYFAGTVVAYSNKVKTKLLGVKPKTLARHGAVSAQCAVEMARGARKLFGTGCAVAVTGIAGPSAFGEGLPDAGLPSGGSRQKPVGLVFASVSMPGKDFCKRKVFGGTRSRIKEKAAAFALNLLHTSIFCTFHLPHKKRGQAIFLKMSQTVRFIG